MKIKYTVKGLTYTNSDFFVVVQTKDCTAENQFSHALCTAVVTGLF